MVKRVQDSILGTHVVPGPTPSTLNAHFEGGFVPILSSLTFEDQLSTYQGGTRNLVPSLLYQSRALRHRELVFPHREAGLRPHHLGQATLPEFSGLHYSRPHGSGSA